MSDTWAGLADVDLPAAVVDASVDGTQVVWINAAFTRLTGYTWPDAIGAPTPELAGLGATSPQLAQFAVALRSHRTASATVRAYRKSGTAYWCEVTLAPIGSDTLWLVIARDVSARVNDQLAGSASKERERRARAGLATLAMISDQLVDVDNRHVLLDVALTLQRGSGRWAAFLLLDDGLGVDGAVLRVPTPPPPGDDVAALALGYRRGNVVVDPATLDPELQPVSVDLVALAEAAGAPAGGRLAVRAVPGRDEVLAVFVETPPDTAEPAGEFVDVADLVARRVGAALETARLVNRERGLAEALQQALLPALQDIASLDVWTYYAPSSEHTQVGGDWYDVGSTEPDRVYAVVGDATGHDVHATAAMGQLRSIVRAYVLDRASPGDVLERTDYLASAMAIRRTASAIVAELTPADSPAAASWLLRYSRAGHMPPLVLRDGTVLVLADGSGPLLGYGTGPRPTGHLDLEPGDVLVLYTDGLVERRNRTLRQGLEELVSAASGCTGVAADIGEELLARLADAPEDDIAVVVIRIPDRGEVLAPGRSRPRSRRWALPSEAASVARARHAAARVCHEWGFPRSDDVELVISELVANAVLHGGGHLRLRMFDLGDAIRIEVEDANPTPPVLVEGHPGRAGGIGLQLIERLGRWGWRPAGDGKLVWATISRTRPASAAAPSN